MSLSSKQCAQFIEWLRPQIELKAKVDRMVEILMGNIHAERPPRMADLLEKSGISKQLFDSMSADDKLAAMEKIWAAEGTPTGSLIAALDMIFEMRYGWPEGTVANLTPADVFLALEHAAEYDAPAKPSIWEITK